MPNPMIDGRVEKTMVPSRLILHRSTGVEKSIPQTMGRVLSLVALVLVILIAKTVCHAASQEDWDGWTQGPFHYTGQYCKACHVRVPAGKSDSQLKYKGDYNLLCKCHDPQRYVHPVGIVPSNALAARIPREFPLEKGKITCLTCHDIHYQCSRRDFEKNSVRGAPYANRTGICFRCHNPDIYQAFNPHLQKLESGEIKEQTCLYCHASVPNTETDTYASLEYVGDLEMICQRCHRIEGRHSGNFNHLVKPSEKMLGVMKKMEAKFDIILPLDAEGKLTCITCHNPHDQGIIPASRPSAKGAGSKYRHRLPGRLCIECHRL